MNSLKYVYVLIPLVCIAMSTVSAIPQSVSQNKAKSAQIKTQSVKSNNNNVAQPSELKESMSTKGQRIVQPEPNVQDQEHIFKNWIVVNGKHIPIYQVNTKSKANFKENSKANQVVVLATLDSVNKASINTDTAAIQKAVTAKDNKTVQTIPFTKGIKIFKDTQLTEDINTVNLTKQDQLLNAQMKKPFVQNNPALINQTKIGQVSCMSDKSLNTFKNLDLISAIERAICHNPEAKNAWIETKIKAMQVKLAQASYYPQINATLDYISGKNIYNVKNADYLSYDTKIKRYGLTVQANWLLYDFGSRKQLSQEAQSLLAMSFAQQDYVLQTIMMQTIQAYYDVLKVEVQLDNAQQLKTYAKKNFEIASARYQAGAGIKSDQLQMHANLVKSESDLIKFKGDLKVAKGNLAAVMGNMAVQDFNIENNSIKNIKLMDLKPIQVLLNQAVQSNPQLKQAQYAIDAAQHKVKATEKTRYPALSFITNLNDYTQDGERSSANTTRQIQAGIQLSIPIFDGFTRKYQVAEARQNLQQKYVDKEKVEQQLVQEIWKNYNLLEAATDNIHALNALNKSAEQSYSVAQGRYQTGVGNILELINAQNLLAESKMKYSTALTEYLVIRYQLLSYVGTLNIW